jgi:hypothetical protein
MGRMVGLDSANVNDFSHIPPNYVVQRVTAQRKPPEVRLCGVGKEQRKISDGVSNILIEWAFLKSWSTCSRSTSEACFRRMKTAGLRIRPVYHWTAHRITSHVRLCVLALLLERAAEIRVGDTWRNLRFALEEVKAVRYRVHGLTLPTFKGVWYAAVNFALVPLLETRLAQCPRPHR